MSPNGVDLVGGAVPNGGYPMHLQLPLAEGLGLMASGSEVVLAKLETKPERTDFLDATALGSMSKEQREALLFHLLYWSGGGSLPRIDVGSLVLKPSYDARGCFYSL